MAERKYVYFFGGGKADGSADMKDLLGGKGANLAEMTNIGLPVPAGFTITTEVCTYYYANDRKLSRPSSRPRSRPPCSKTEEVMGAKFGDAKNPLLVSCRSGARVSMPGMMDTVLNIGLNEATLQGPHRQDRQRTLRLGQLSPLRADVRRRRARPQAADQERDRSVRADHGRAEARARASSSTPS